MLLNKPFVWISRVVLGRGVVGLLFLAEGCDKQIDNF
jgi:hypothetical protein